MSNDKLSCSFAAFIVLDFVNVATITLLFKLVYM